MTITTTTALPTATVSSATRASTKRSTRAARQVAPLPEAYPYSTPRRVAWKHVGEAVTQGHGRAVVPSRAMKRQRSRIVTAAPVQVGRPRGVWNVWADNVRRVAESVGGFVCGLAALVLVLGVSPMLILADDADQASPAISEAVQADVEGAQAGQGAELGEFMTR